MALVALRFLLAASVAATPSGRALTGVVTDPSGAVVPAVTVLATNDTGATVGATTTDAQGAFALEALAPGRYQVQVRVQGFKPFTTTVKVDGRPRRPLEVKLELASVEEEVTVEKAASTDAGENADAVRVDAKGLQEYPILDQDYIKTLSAFLDPGMVGAGGPSLVVDGAEVSRVPVSPSAIQEIKIDENPYSAEYFRPGRGRIEIVTKQGTPEYHGALNVVFRDSRLNARDFFAPEKAPEQRRNFEGYLTGPVGRSRTTTFQVSFDRRQEDLESIVVAASPAGPVRDNVPVRQRATDLSARVTRQWGKKHSLWLRYSLEDRATRNQGAGGFTLAEAAFDNAGREDQLALSDQFLVSPKLLNQLQVLLEWNHGSTSSLSAAPRVVVQDAFTAGGAQADQRSRAREARIFEALTWTRGRHRLKVGFQTAEWTHRTFDDLSNRGGTFFFSSLQDYAEGRPYSFTQQAGNGLVALFQKAVGGFVQDEFQWKPNLSLAVGARYDYQNLIHSGRLAPRAFAAFAPRGRKIVLRAGVGFFNDRFPAPAAADAVRFDGRHLSSYVLLDPSYPDPTGGLIPLSAQPASIVRFDPTLRSTQIIQYSAGAEWQVAKATALTVTYRGSRGVGLLRSRDVNAPQGPVFATRPDPALGRVRQIESAGRQTSDAVELGFRGKAGKVFSGLAQYTLSRTDNDTSGLGYFPADNLDPRADWGPADFDQRHRLNLLGSVALKRIVKIGVAFAAASGKPYSLTTGRDDNHDGFATDRPAGVARNGLRAPGWASLDIQVSRDLFFDQAKGDKGPTASLGVGAFNVLNSLSATTIVGAQTSPFFGQAVAALPARRVQLSARLSF